MRYASPATDLGYYIFGCTTKALRDAHFHEFLDAYYETLSKFIRRYINIFLTFFLYLILIFEDLVPILKRFFLAMLLTIK